MGTPAAVQVDAPAPHSGTRLRVRRLLAIVAICAITLLAITVPVNLVAQTGGGMVELAALAAAAMTARLGVTAGGLLRVAMLAQLADLGTFVFSWQGGIAELNPLSGLILALTHAALPAGGSFSVGVAGAILLCAKFALLVFLARAAPVLGRYRVPVLVLAVCAGTIGALSNVIALLPGG